MVATGYGVDKSMKNKTDLSDLALANVEALANNEDGGMNINPYLTFCIVILYSFVVSCKRTTEVSYYFSDDVQVIELTTNDLTGTLLILL